MSHLTDAYLAGTAKGAKSDNQAVKNYRASRDCINKALPDIRLHVLREELEWVMREIAAAESRRGVAPLHLIYIRDHLRARVAELEGQKQ